MCSSQLHLVNRISRLHKTIHFRQNQQISLHQQTHLLRINNNQLCLHLDLALGFNKLQLSVRHLKPTIHLLFQIILSNRKLQLCRQVYLHLNRNNLNNNRRQTNLAFFRNRLNSSINNLSWECWAINSNRASIRSWLTKFKLQFKFLFHLEMIHY